jgi:2'-5' RNA ligase
MSGAPLDPLATARVFVGIPLPDRIQHQIAQVVDRVRPQLPSRCVRWVRPENMHLTLRFIGNVPVGELEPLAAALHRCVAGVRPFALQLAQPGWFPEGGAPRVLWIGLAGELESLEPLQRNVTGQTSAWGALEGRPFRPHLTLGRVLTRRRDELRRMLTGFRGLDVPRDAGWEVDAVHLIQSILEPTGTRYSTLANARLTG